MQSRQHLWVVILVAGGRFLRKLFERELPLLWRSFRPASGSERDGFQIGRDLGDLYDALPTLDFSKDLLERAADRLWVYPVPACGWLDLGTPERLTGHLSAQSQRQRDREDEHPVPSSTRMHRWTGDATAATVGKSQHSVV